MFQQHQMSGAKKSIIQRSIDRLLSDDRYRSRCDLGNPFKMCLDMDYDMRELYYTSSEDLKDILERTWNAEFSKKVVWEEP